MADATIRVGFPVETALSQALHDIADAFVEAGRAGGAVAFTPAELLIVGATVRELAGRAGHMELSLGLFESEAVYDAANDPAPALSHMPGGTR